MQQKHEQYDAHLKWTQGSLLTEQMITPGMVIEKIVVCDTGEITPEVKGDFEVVVSIDGEEHRFNFEHS